MSKLLSSIALMTMLCFSNQLCANDGLKSVTFQDTISQYIYAAPHGWIEQEPQILSVEGEELYKFVSADGKSECFINFICYKDTAKITETVLIEEIILLNKSIYGDRFLAEKELHTFSYFNSSDESACLAMTYVINGQEGQMLEFIWRMTSRERPGAVCILIKKNEKAENLHEEFKAMDDFLSNINFL